MKKQFYVLAILIVSILAQAFLASAQLYGVNLTSSYSTTSNNPYLVVQALNYAPYPVNAGDWFDLWVKVQNVGQNDAPNARFELAPEYPFSAVDSLVKDYGLLDGAINAYKVDQTYAASQVILKYRVKVADNAPEGTSNLKIITTTDSKNPATGSIVTLLPITIGKTKTDFDVVMQDSSTQGTSFAISNIGENAATAITVTLEPQDFGNFTRGNFTGGSQPRNFTSQRNSAGRAGFASSNSTGVTSPISTILGNLAAGDFTTVTFQTTLGNANMARLRIDYTDIAGVRNTVEKIVPVNTIQKQTTSLAAGANGRKTTPSVSSYVYLIVGALLGALALVIYNRVRAKKK